MPPIPPVTKTLLLACVAMFLAGALLPAVMGPIESMLALWPLESGRFMPWQVLSYGFLHGDTFHLAFNMLGLWIFGSDLERLWGQRRYLQFLLAGVLTAAAAQLLVTYLMGSPYPTVGASGALFALLLGFGMLFPERTIVPLFPPIPMKAKTFVIVFGALELVLGLSGQTGIAHFAHLGGMLGGFLMIRYWRGQSPFRGRRRW
jgi:membrane associated rhomboid family serine protease